MFAVEDDGDLTPINKVDIDGMRGCYLSVDKTGRYLFVAGYHDGKVTVAVWTTGRYTFSIQVDAEASQDEMLSLVEAV